LIKDGGNLMPLSSMQKIRQANARKQAAAKAKKAKAIAKTEQKEKKRAAKEKMVTWSLRLPNSVHAQLKAMAKAQGRSANKQVEMLIRDASPSQSDTVQSTVLKSIKP
jgi:predicted HicB family RNase H-like nuclease